jgi:hypothetical protein
MKTADFRGEITPNGEIAVPAEIASQIPPGEKVAVVLDWGVSDEENAWREPGRRRFQSAYGPEDSVYDQLIHEPSAGFRIRVDLHHDLGYPGEGGRSSCHADPPLAVGQYRFAVGCRRCNLLIAD